MPTFECDPVKSHANVLKHGLSLVEAEQLWLDPEKLYLPSGRIDVESRYKITALYQEKLWTCVFTVRETRYRLISFRRAQQKETRAYFGRRV